jgi:predicted GIY-YIG superfamily endonuclease
VTKWCLYLLYHTESNRTYLGVTTDINRRVRQHNREIKGGARFTSRILIAHPNTAWKLVACLNDFLDQSAVTRWEKLLKLKVRGIKARLLALENIAEGKYPKEFSDKMKEKYEIPKVFFQSF